MVISHHVKFSGERPKKKVPGPKAACATEDSFSEKVKKQKELLPFAFTPERIRLTQGSGVCGGTIGHVDVRSGCALFAPTQPAQCWA